jgi:tRNA-dihydrouridine synthase A
MSADMTRSHFYAEALKTGRPVFSVAPMIDWMGDF